MALVQSHLEYASTVLSGSIVMQNASQCFNMPITNTRTHSIADLHDILPCNDLETRRKYYSLLYRALQNLTVPLYMKDFLDTYNRLILHNPAAHYVHHHMQEDRGYAFNVTGRGLCNNLPGNLTNSLDY